MDINKTFNTTLDAVSRDGIELSNKMESISKGNMSNEELVQLQFQIGQYNANWKCCQQLQNQ